MPGPIASRFRHARPWARRLPFAVLLLAGTPVLAKDSWLALLGLEDALGSAEPDAEAAEARFLGAAHEALDAGDIAAAQRFFEAALAANPSSAQALTYLGLIHEGAGHRNLSIAMYQRVLALADLRAAASTGADAESWAPFVALSRARLQSMAVTPAPQSDERANVVARFATLAELWCGAMRTSAPCCL